jgi:hypothetical protein
VPRSFREIDAASGGLLTYGRQKGLSFDWLMVAFKSATSFGEVRTAIDASVWLRDVMKKGRPNAENACAG